MEDESRYLITALKGKIELIIEKHRSLLAEYLELKTKHESCEKELMNFRSEMEKLRKEHDSLLFARSLNEGESGSGNEQVKLQIDRMVREIDECIRLINE